MERQIGSAADNTALVVDAAATHRGPIHSFPDCLPDSHERIGLDA